MNMKTISIAVDEHLLEQIDTLAQARHQKRAELFSEAARQWLKQQRIKVLVKQDRQGYRKQPVQPDEFEPFLRAQQRRQSRARSDGDAQGERPLAPASFRRNCVANPCWFVLSGILSASRESERRFSLRL